MCSAQCRGKITEVEQVVHGSAGADVGGPKLSAKAKRAIAAAEEAAASKKRGKEPAGAKGVAKQPVVKTAQAVAKQPVKPQRPAARMSDGPRVAASGRTSTVGRDRWGQPGSLEGARAAPAPAVHQIYLGAPLRAAASSPPSKNAWGSASGRAPAPANAPAAEPPKSFAAIQKEETRQAQERERELRQRATAAR